jgi:DNA-binding CsgD family transcriptional regulator
MKLVERNAARPVGEVFVARDRELERVVELATGHPTDDSWTVLVRGEPGIGKSQLLDHAVAALVRLRRHVVTIRSDELERRVPYAALRHALGSFHPALSPESATLAQALAETLDVAAERPVGAVHVAAAQLFAALRDEAPTVLAFDDLQLADEDTIVLVADLVRRDGRHPLVLLATMCKPDTAPRDWVAALLERSTRDGLLKTLDLEPFDDLALADLVRALLGREPTAELLAVVHHQSEGNPFFATQALLNIIEEGSPSAGLGLLAGPAHLSDDRRRVLLTRILRVGPNAQHLSRAIALLAATGSIRPRLAAEMAGLEPSEADEAFDVLIERGILRDDADDGYSFCHRLVRDALYQELGPAQRWRWHRLAADRLDALPHSPDHDLELAAHVREVAEMGDESAIAVLSRAADWACATAPRSSVPWFEAALAVTPADHPHRGELTSRLARALFLAGRPREAADAGRAALARIAPGTTRSRVVSLVIEALLEISATTEAAELIDADDGPPRLRLAAQTAHVFAMRGRNEEADRVTRGILRALPSAPPSEQILALVHVAHARCLQPHYSSLPELWSALEGAAADAPVTARLSAYAVMSCVQAMLGETAACSRSLSTAQRLLAESGWTLYRAELAVAQAQLTALLGEWSSALSVISSVGEQLESAGALAHLTVLRDIETEIHSSQGNWVLARRAAERPLSGNPALAALQVWARAGLNLLTGDLAAARAALEAHLDRAEIPGGGRALLLSRLADVEHEGGNAALAGRLVAGAARLGHDAVDHPTYIACRYAYGQAVSDADSIREGLAVADEHGLAFLRGRGRLLLGVLDVEPEANLTDAARIFRALDATPWRRRAISELRARGLKLPRQRIARPAALLTETEAQVARLVQQGRRNREIAMTVFLSVKTVEAYLSRIYTKTGCANRMQLARALDAGLLGQDGDRP